MPLMRDTQFLRPSSHLNALDDSTEPSRVVLLWNSILGWTKEELAEEIADNQFTVDGLKANGFEVTNVCLFGSVKQSLLDCGYEHDKWLVLNMCNGYTDRVGSQVEVVEELERLGYIFTGAKSKTLKLCSDKRRVRYRIQKAGLLVPYGIVVHQNAGFSWKKYPAIVKPPNQHSSIGITRDSLVMNDKELRQQVEYVIDLFHTPALIEEYIDGREFTVTIWGNNPPSVLPPVELEFSAFNDLRDRIFTYNAKFFVNEDECVNFLFPAMLEVQNLWDIQSACMKVYRVFGCRDCARIDMRLCEGRVYLLDVNPNPDLNFGSSVDLAAYAAGIEYDKMLTRIISFAFERWNENTMHVHE